LWGLLVREYIDELQLPRGADAEKLRYPLPPKDISIANTALPLVRLNHYIRSGDGSTHVDALLKWRASGGNDANWVVNITGRPGDPKVDSAHGLVELLCYGSPALRFPLHLIVSRDISANIDESPI
jgi:hypothetical protein